MSIWGEAKGRSLTFLGCPGLEAALPGSFKHTHFQKEGSLFKTCCFEFAELWLCLTSYQQMDVKNSLQGVNAGGRASLPKMARPDCFVFVFSLLLVVLLILRDTKAQ